MPSRQPRFSINDERGHQIGSVQKVLLGRQQREFWQALSLDGCDLGAHVKRIDAEEAIQDDWDAGRPRDSTSPSQRWRPIIDPHPPILLGR